MITGFTATNFKNGLIKQIGRRTSALGLKVLGIRSKDLDEFEQSATPTQVFLQTIVSNTSQSSECWRKGKDDLQ